MSVEYYSKLERGNLSGVSPAVLEALARALQLDDAERASATAGTRSADKPSSSPSATAGHPCTGSAGAFRQAMYELDMIGLAWYEAAGMPSRRHREEFRSLVVTAARAKRQPDKNFQIAARTALNTET
ncbi:helix-turn-helix domain-containing protein [Streptomyces sp. NPDC048156]|uniref:helix-turn-helix domain-containing protein n=1 Tax=Streptomyces sp. NPDC048156 TaxID=3365502 RepID=UPI003718053D